MKLLFDDRLAPITETIGFVEAPVDVAVKAFLDWERSIHAPLGRTFTEQPVRAALEPTLLALLPLTSIQRLRYLFLPTASPWTAFIDNGHQGTDAFSVMSSLAKRIGCRAMRVTAAPNTIEGEFREARGRYGGLVFELYGPERTRFLNYMRAISLINDGGRWDFSQSGTPLPFEDVESYSARRKRDRFTFERLEALLHDLGLSPFDEDFYLPAGAGPAILVERHGARPERMKEYSLAEARAHYVRA